MYIKVLNWGLISNTANERKGQFPYLPNSLTHRSPSKPHGGSSTGGAPFGQLISWYKFSSCRK